MYSTEVSLSTYIPSIQKMTSAPRKYSQNDLKKLLKLVALQSHSIVHNATTLLVESLTENGAFCLINYII